MSVVGRYKPYPVYKASGLEWLGDIPEGWEMIQSRRLFSQRKERARPNDEQLTASQKYGIIYQKEFMKIESQRVVQVITGSEILKHVEADDFVISMRSFQGGLEWCKYAGCVSSAYVGVVPQKHIVPAFFAYFFKCKQYIQALQSTSNLVRDGQALRFDNFAQVPLPIVPEREQTQIAAFLDYETVQIDALIAKQQRLIALLEEKRQAVISHAVTKGLDPTAPLRPSGIGWLGDVPEHWEVVKGKYVFEFITSGSRGWADYYSDEGALFFRIANLTRDTIRPKLLSIQRVSPPRGAEGERSQIRLGDLLVSITADLGSVCVADEHVENGYVSQHVALCRPQTEIASSDWLGFCILSDSCKSQLLESGYGGTKVQLSLPDIRELNIVKPPANEQVEIARFLNEKLELFAKGWDAASKQITLLKERRTTLISAAVTGKIDLRDWQAPERDSDISAQDIDQNEEALA